MKFTEKIDKILEDMAPTEAPTKAPTKPKTPTKPSKPKKPKWDPNRKWDPKPGPAPKPKAKADMNDLSEEYNQEVNPNIANFWKNLATSDHRFSKHPVMAVHGDQLSKASWKHTKERIEKISGGEDPEDLSIIANLIIRKEAEHKKELENLAIDTVSDLWNIPREKLEAMITQNVDVEEGGGDDNIFSDEEAEELTKEVNKRITMNTMTQGAAVHSMMTIHHLIRNEIKKIDSDLIDLYDTIAAGSVNLYWLVDFASLMAVLSSAAVGSSKLEFDEDGKAKVVAKGVVFPVLIQELVKGTMDLITYHHISELGPEKGEKVIHHADKLHYEPYEIQVGPEIWRRFLKVINPVINELGYEITDVVGALSIQEPDDVHDIIMFILDDRGDDAVRMLKELLSDPDDFDENEFQDFEYDPDEPEFA